VQFVRWGTAGGYPIIALAPSSVAECYALTRRAFDLAERFRCPVFLLTDKELNMTTTTVEVDHYDKPAVRARAALPSTELPYRYVPAADVPPLAQYGGPGTVRFTGSTHDERALITKAPAKVAQLNEHLRAKIEDHAEEIELLVKDLQPGATTLFVSYGITAGGMRDAVTQLRAAGRAVSALTVQSLWPVPERAIREAFAGITRIVVAELNHGQYRREIERLARDIEVVGLHRVDGELIAPGLFMEALR
jgi:2-oxoglutarate ferredoxin oxidoreductase subunit alpha